MAPINFYQDKTDSVAVRVTNSKGDGISVLLTEVDPFSTSLAGKVTLKKDEIQSGGQTLSVNKGEVVKISYGYGYFKKETSFKY